MIVVPTIIEYFNPKQLMEKTMIQWTTWLCHQLRLTSFLLGGRPINEEGYIYYKTWKAWIQRPELNNATLQEHNDDKEEEEEEENDLAIFIRNGLLVRAPKHDGVRYIPGRRMLVPVDPITLEALDPSERSLGHPATRSDQDEEQEEHTTIVYLPPQFKLRIGILMSIMWISWSVLLCCVFVGPIAVGRGLFQYNGIVAQPGKKIHDIYAYFIGGCAMILVGVLVKKIKSVISKFSTFDFSHVLYIMNWVCFLSQKYINITIYTLTL
jgi:E3 ubiquitin-protein ligase DOA10